jgi:hypothetical protein
VLEKDGQYWKEERYHKIIWEQDSWTVLEDPELILCFEEDTLMHISRSLGARVLATVDQSTSGACEVWYYYQGNKQIGTYVLGGKLVESYNTDAPASFSERDLIALLREFGFKYKKTQKHHQFLLKNLNESQEPDTKILEPLEPSDDRLDPKKWWQFWK